MKICIDLISLFKILIFGIQILNVSSKNVRYFNKIRRMLLIYDAIIGNNTLEFIRLGKENDGGYVVPIVALETADVLMGYGIATDISFERDFSKLFNKPSYGFDCGVENINTGDSNCHFINECIGTSNYLYKSQASSGKISTYSEQIKNLKLSNKKIFIKMDIEGAEYIVMNDILKYSKNITGIVIEIHYSNEKEVLKLLSSLSRNFILLHLHGNNCCSCKLTNKFPVPVVIELTYINKNLVSSYKFSKNQKHPLPIDQPNIKNKKDCVFDIRVK